MLFDTENQANNHIWRLLGSDASIIRLDRNTPESPVYCIFEKGGKPVNTGFQTCNFDIQDFVEKAGIEEFGIVSEINRNGNLVYSAVAYSGNGEELES